MKNAWQYFFISLIFFIAMMTLVFLYIFHSWHHQYDGSKQDSILAERIDFLLRNARLLGGEILRQYQPDLSCSPDTACALEQAALRYPHVHGVFLYHNGKIYCSSLRQLFTPDATFQDVTRSANDGKTLLLSGIKGFPGKVFLTYIRGNQKRGVVVTIDAYWLRRWFAANGQNGLLVADKVLTRDQTVTEVGSVRSQITNTLSSPLSGASVVSFRHDTPHLFFWPAVAVLILAAGLLTILALGRFRRNVFPTLPQLEQAIHAGEMVPWYQPIMDATTGQVRGVEVLARWHHPRKGVLPPDLFIPLAERSGLLVPMTQALLDQVRRDMDVLKFRLPDKFYISVNISATPEIVEALSATLTGFRHAFHNHLKLVVELTERTAVRSDSPVIALLQELRAEGIGIALDDFGTAYSNISKINKLPVTSIKIDQSFIRKLADSMESQRLVESIIELARSNRLSVVAEGVETAFQSDFLAARGVALQQGYYWSKPLPVMDFARFLIWHRTVPGMFSEERNPV
ncbi:EAL domain-containing protein [Klebsiella pneumoniae]|uniref:EAL domain-containing protein n=1 Tax=Klebsiella pneumoniae TaxID=573 RepID=UPI000DF93036|nr:EAL domain-containing protein [Klebsiella pneumoniae]STS63050.1 Rtn protein [Klebsiella aerogenes]MEA4354186.1 EAL domain-containing protein [Klebsiella pneumoniae]MEA4430807.1 EAL domain-containing protein [Klebsiella pneumoniae]MEA4748366.1 EAL domain-containing protein [Klebsiella pneumoniae]VTQ38278.1 putative signal transduction protein [Klebsiella pneumoniae]